MTIRAFFENLRSRPSASALGFLFVASSAITLTHTGLNADALAGLLPEWAFTLFAAAYGIAGLLTLDGVGRKRLNVEAAGAVLIVTGVGARIVAVVTVLPFSPAVLFNALLLTVFALAYLERFRQCIRGEQIIHVDKIIEMRSANDAD
jgi:hypothetical protein